jgi:hypothetical protein
LLIAEVSIDLMWARIYYPNETYFNYGIGAVYGLLVWISTLVVTLVMITAQNRKAVRQANSSLPDRRVLQTRTAEHRPDSQLHKIDAKVLKA